MKRILILCVGLLGSPASALTVMESQTDHGNSWVVLDPGEEAAQTFTVSAAGSTVVSAVSFWLSQVGDSDSDSTATLTVEIQGVTSGEPDNNALWSTALNISTTYSASTIFAIRDTVSVSPPLRVGPADERALVLRVTGGTYNQTRVLWGGSDTDLYTAGEALSREVGPDDWTNYPDYDIDRDFEILTP